MVTASVPALDQRQADVLAGRICAAAGLAAQSDCRLLELIGEFDAAGAVRWWTDVKSLAHWLSWACSMSPGTAREHVRVARALRRMPAVTGAFREGRLSYSKVREVTRVVDVLEETKLLELALTATASQLGRMLSAFRSTAGSRLAQERSRSLSWTEREDESVEFRVRLPKEEAAVLVAALTSAKDQFGSPPATTRATAKPGPGVQVDSTPAYGYAQAIVDVAQGFLDVSPRDESGEDRTVVMVHVAAGHLAGPASDRPVNGVGGVPAGTPDAMQADPTCSIEGLGGIEPETARRLACDAELIGAVVSDQGEPLVLGRSRRLVTRAQRRALMIRDGMCQFPGCAQVRHLKAHHIKSWAVGGPTDLENLILLCQFQHTAVHEGGMSIVRVVDPGPGRRWEFRMPDGSPHRTWHHAEWLLTALLHDAMKIGSGEEANVIEAVDRFGHPDAQRIVPGWRGEPFDLHACVEALFAIRLPESQPMAA